VRQGTLGHAALLLALLIPACGSSDAGADPPEPYQVTVETVGAFPAGVHGMAVDSDGTLWFSDSYRNVLPLEQVYTLPAPYTGEPEGTDLFGSIPAGLLWHAGDLLVCFTGEDEIRRFDADLALVATWSVPAPWNVIALGEDLLTVTYHGEVRRLEADGASTVLFGDLEFPFDLAAAGPDAIWVSEQVEADVDGRVTRFGLDGTVLEPSAAIWDNPEGLILDDRGTLYVADTNAGMVFRRVPDGKVGMVATMLTAPITFARLPDGDLLLNTSAARPELIRLRLE